MFLHPELTKFRVQNFQILTTKRHILRSVLDTLVTCLSKLLTIHRP